MTGIGVILGSTRPGRRGEAVAHWVMDEAGRRGDADFELVDLAEYPLPHLDEPLPPSMGQYQNAHTQRWAETIGRFDGYVFVTPEYNHSTSGVLKNAIDLRLIAGELQMADVRTNVTLSLFTDFENFTDFKPGAHQAQVLDTLLGEVIAWSRALAPLRQVSQAA